MTTPKILVTGATGYIGGSVLTTLLESTNLSIDPVRISVLVRKQEQAEILSEKGVKPILFNGLDDTTALKDAAGQHDIVINAASAFKPRAAEALILGLAERKRQLGTDVHLIQTTGTSSVADLPSSGTYTETRILSDMDDIYAYERSREDHEPYLQRTTDLIVFEKGQEAGVRTYLLMSPTIYGPGTGLFNRRSIQIVGLMRAAQRDGYASVIGSGAAEWDHVHIDDLLRLYELIISRILTGEVPPSNRKGIYFSETGHHSWREVSERIAREGRALGYLVTDEVREASLLEAVEKLGGGTVPSTAIELGFASRARTRADRAREIGWRPSKTRQDFEDSFAEEWRYLASES